MIRFFIFYTAVIYYRVFRMLIREKITGDNNYLSSPIMTIHRVMSHACVHSKSHFVDIGCGEGLAAVYMRLILKKNVVCCDLQSHYLNMISFLTTCLFISKVVCQPLIPFFDHDNVVYLCVWTSWSKRNRQRMIEQFLTHIPKGGILVTVSHGIVHPDLLELDCVQESFAWGPASVYYYQHA